MIPIPKEIASRRRCHFTGEQRQTGERLGFQRSHLEQTILVQIRRQCVAAEGDQMLPFLERALLIDDAVEAPTGNVRSIHGAWNQRISVSRKIDERLNIVPSIIKPDASALG